MKRSPVDTVKISTSCSPEHHPSTRGGIASRTTATSTTDSSESEGSAPPLKSSSSTRSPKKACSFSAIFYQQLDVDSTAHSKTGSEAQLSDTAATLPHHGCPAQTGPQYNGPPSMDLAILPRSATQNNISRGSVYSGGGVRDRSTTVDHRASREPKVTSTEK